MKRKRSVWIITKLIILSLILGLCLPSFADQVNAAWLETGYGINGAESHLDLNLSYIYAERESAPTEENPDNDKLSIQFTPVKPSTLGYEKYILFYEANQGGDWTEDCGFFKGINIPLRSTEKDWNHWIYKFEHFNFEDDRLNWNFSQNPATDQMYITTDEGERIPVYIIGACQNYSFDENAERDTKVTWTSAEELNESLKKLYSLVDSIEKQNGTAIGKYYPEHAELLKEVSVEARRIIFASKVKVAGYSATGLITQANIADNSSAAIERCKASNVIYGNRFFAAMKKIVDGYVTYVNTHKIAEPSISSATMDGTTVNIDNSNFAHKF